MPPVPLTPEAMTSLERSGVHMSQSLPECEGGDARGSSSNEQDLEEKATDRVAHFEGKIRVLP